MPVTEHRPDSISLAAERLFSVGSYSCISKYWNWAFIKKESSYIIMVMTFIIMATFCSEEPVRRILYITELSFRIPCKWRNRTPELTGTILNWSTAFNLCIKLIDTFSYRHDTFQALQDSEYILPYCRKRLLELSILLVHKIIDSKVTHFAASDSSTIIIYERHCHGQFCRRICEIHNPLVAHVRAWDILSHCLYLRILIKRKLSSCSIIHDLEIIIKLSGCMTPISRSLLACTICLDIGKELIYWLERLTDCLMASILVLIDKEICQHDISIAPRVPVIYYCTGL